MEEGFKFIMDLNIDDDLFKINNLNKLNSDIFQNQLFLQDPPLIENIIDNILNRNDYNLDNIRFNETEIDILIKFFGYYSEKYTIKRIADIYNLPIKDVVEIIKIGKRKIYILLEEDNLISKGYIKCKAKNR